MKKLYDQLFEAGEYTGSFEDFKKQYGDTEKSKVLFDGLAEAGDYTQSFETFNTQYEFPPAKKLGPADVDPAVESKNDTGSISTDGSWGYQGSDIKTSKFDPFFENLNLNIPDLASQAKNLTDLEMEQFLNSLEDVKPGSKLDLKTAMYKQDIQDETQKIFNNRITGVKKTELGTVDFDDNSAVEFRKKALLDFTSNNSTIQDKIIPKVKKEVKPQLDDYVKKLMVKYDLSDPKSITQENLDLFNEDVSGFYNSLINTKLSSNADFKAITNAFDESIDERSEGMLRDFSKSKDMPILFSLAEDAKDTWYLNETVVKGLTKAVTGLRSMGNSIRENSINKTIQNTTDKIADLNRNTVIATKNNWTDDTVGYWVKSNSSDGQEGYKFSPKYASDLGWKDEGASTRVQRAPVSSFGEVVEGTWKDFKTELEDYVIKEDNDARKKLVEVQNEDQILANYNDNELDEIFKGNNIVSNLVSLAGEQLPQMALALVTLGGSGAIQMGGDIYTQGIENEARVRFNIPEDQAVSISQKRQIFLDEKFMNGLEAKAVSGGFVAGQLEKLGAGKALKPFVIKGTKSILRSGYKNFLKGAANNLVSNTQNSAIELITEVGQEIIVAGAAGGELKADQIFDAGATGFLVSMTTGMGGNIKNQTVAEVKNLSSIMAGKLNSSSAEAIFNFKIKEVESLIKDASISDSGKKELIEKRNILIEAKKASISIPKELSAEYRGKAIDLVIRKRTLEKQIEGKEPQLVTKQKEEIKNIDIELEKVAIDNSLNRNIESVEKLASNIEGINVKSLDNAEAIDAFIAENKLDIDKKASGEQGFIYQNPDTGEQTIVINKEVAAKEQAVNVAAHEFLHGLLFQTVKNSPETQISLGKSLNEYINKIDTKQVKDSDFAKRLESYKDMDVATQSEEVLTLFSDAIATGDIQFNESVFTKVGDVIRRTLQNLGVSIKFNNGKDVYNFIKDYNKSIKKGSLTGAQKIAANKGVKGSLVLGKTEENTTNVKESKSTTATPLEAINALMPNTVKTQAEYFSPRVFNPIYNALEDNGVISNYIKSKSLSKEVASKTIESIRERLINFDPEATRKNKGNAEPITFGEFIFANTNFGKLDAKKALFKESQEDSNKIDIDSEQAKGIAVVESSTKKAEAPEYRKIIDSNVLFKDVVSNVKAKVLKTVRTLKSKLDANVSKNKTVTPIIAEIKKEMGKQADIDLKKAIGGKANGQMERFLIKNKKAILENMTTTWLTKAIPGAIQKMVNGNWTSDWSGKKIDRESTKTDNAGRTSGAEMIRRKPNVANMPDAEFLGYFLDSKGDPIRGRKESLAKAMAEEISLEIFNRELQDENSEISKAFENNQQLKGVELTEAYIAEVSKQIERGNVKFSLSPDQLSVFNSNSQQILAALREANVNVTGITLYNISKKILGDKIDDKALKNYTLEIANHVQRYIDKVDIKSKVNFNNFVFEGLQLKESNSNLYKAFNFTRKQIGSLAGLFNSTNVATQRGLSYAFNAKVVEEQGSDGLIKLLKWTRGHQTSSGKIGDGRNQIYKGNPDYIDNNLNNIPGVKVDYSKDKSTSIKAVYYKGVEIDGWKEKIKTPPQSAGDNTEKSRAKFVQDYQVREDAAREAWAVLNEYLSFVKENGNEIDWIMTMMSLKSNMASVLKAAAPVKYYYKGVYTGSLRYEHMIPTEYMVLKLTEYYWNGKKFDLNALRDRYNVAIIPVKMDDNFNIQRQSQMNPGYDPMVDSEIDRYFDKGTFGYPDMYAIEEIGGNGKGMVHGEAWVKLSKLINAEAFTTIQTQQKAINNATSVKWSKSPKKIRVFDFDDTLARTKSNVLYTMPDGTTGKIDAATFAKDAGKMEAEGAVWDFSEFSKVMNGKKGPLFEVAKIIADKRGTEDVFVLTARPADAAGPIQEFLSELGLDIPLKNITGLGDGNPKAKADWMISKVAEGYNDFYFADDHTGNVNAVKDVLDTFDVKGKVQLAKVKFSKSLDPEFNSMIERNKGVGASKEFSKIVAKRRGANKGKYKAFITSSADDFRGLTSYTFAGKGKQGEADQAFFEDALLTPYFRGVNALESARVAIKSDFKQLGKIFKPEVKKLGELTPDGDFTYDQALRVYMWDKQGTEIPGISKRDQAKLVKLIEEDTGLKAFSEAAVLATKKDGWPDPGEYWDAKTMLSDLNDLTETSNRAEYIAEFIENADIIFSEKNLNKIEAIYGTKHREALEDALYAMKNGTNRSSGSNKITNKWNNWVNNSIGTIMFFNRRSALMQTLSITNFLNWSDNNPLKAGLAFANQPQYWKDFVMIFNSDKLKQRRGGLKADVQEAEIANAAKGAKNKPQAIISYLLKKGFLPTQIADSFAISMGGASMYRNRVNTYKNQGFDLKTAEEKAFLDFSKISDETQQSGDPALVSQQQRSVAGRLILAFQNTTMQYTRLMKKSAQDLINGRGDAKTHISKIVYYGAVQNFIFNALSNSLFALIPGFGDEDEEEIDEKELDKKSTRVLHGMFDSVAKGTGIYGAVVVTLKNAYRAYDKETEKGFMGQSGWQTASEMLNIAPAIGSKFKKVKSAIDVLDKYDKDIIEKHPWDVVIDGRFNPSSTYTVIGNFSSAIFNVPLDRALAEARGISEMLDDRNTVFQRVALGLGWRTWDVGAKNEEFDLIKSAAKKEKKKKKKSKPAGDGFVKQNSKPVGTRSVKQR